MKKRQPSPLPLFPSSPIPKMQEGYYSGDKPNPNLRTFVEAHLKEWPYDPATDDYAVPAFDKPIESTKATAIYNMHTYWSKKPHDAIRQYIRHYTKPGDLVLDSFCGSGGTALAALMEGRKAIAIDRSPAATFITKNYCTPVDVEALQTAFEELRLKVKPEINRLYETRCDRCGGKATTVYTVYSQVVQCPRCLTAVSLFECVSTSVRTSEGRSKKISVCPHCYQKGLVEEVSAQGQRGNAIPVLTAYVCDSGCRPPRSERRYDDSNGTKRAYFENHDLAKLAEIDLRPIPYWVPEHGMMNAQEGVQRWALLWRPYLGTRIKVADFFRHRNLWALAIIRTGIEALGSSATVLDALRFAFSGSVLNASDMYRFRESGKGGIAMGTYYVGPTFQVVNAWRVFEDKVRDLMRGYGSLVLGSMDVSISCQSATDLTAIPANSVDYVFTDPPYSWKVQYGEANFIWEAWLNLDTQWHGEEIIVNEFRGKSEADWAARMRYAMAECYRVLKPGRWLSLCYHDTSEGTWELVQDILAETGLVADQSDSALFIDTGQKAWKQIVSDKTNKRDLVINFRKPKPGEILVEIKITGEEDDETFAEKVRAIVREYLNHHPGAAKDRIYDEVVSRMVRAGRMEAHNFDELLAQVAEPVHEPLLKNLFERQPPNLFGTHEIVRWYLKETEVDKIDAAESAKEDATAKGVQDLVAKRMKERPEEEGIHYSDIFEHYVYAVKDKPRRLLQDWLLDYFYKTPAGTYRLAATDEEAEAKARGRAAGTNRRIKRYVAYLEQGTAVPDKERPGDSTLVEWIRHCKRSGLYEQGRLLYEKGGLNLDNLPEEAMVNVEEDYQVCVRMLARAGQGKQARKDG